MLSSAASRSCCGVPPGWVAVEGEDSRTGQRWPCVSASLTFVAIDAAGKPTPVPPLALDSDEARAAQAAGARRREARLRARG